MNNNKQYSYIKKEEYNRGQAWGLLAIINLYNCDKELINDKEVIKKYITELCRLIKMKRYGAPMIERFAENALEGYSAIQFIETSSVTIHFDESGNRAFIDIFSCQYFDSEKAAEFSKKFFKADTYQLNCINRK